MPEGDTIHELAAVLGPELAGARVAELKLEHQLARSWSGRAIDEVFALGKHLFLASGDEAVRTHLGMEGTWHRYRPDERWHLPAWSASVVLRTESRVYVCFRAKEVELVDLLGDRHRRFLRRLGPDLLGDRFSADEAVARARALLTPDAPLADVLLDQRIAAGVGNVYKSELCFLERLHPALPLAALEDATLARLFTRARELLQQNLRPGPRSTRARRPHVPGELRTADDPGLWVYRRAGAPCLRCGGKITFARLGRSNRATWWCPTCQPAEDLYQD